MRSPRILKISVMLMQMILAMESAQAQPSCAGLAQSIKAQQPNFDIYFLRSLAQEHQIRSLQEWTLWRESADHWSWTLLPEDPKSTPGYKKIGGNKNFYFSPRISIHEARDILKDSEVQKYIYSSESYQEAAKLGILPKGLPLNPFDGIDDFSRQGAWNALFKAPEVKTTRHYKHRGGHPWSQEDLRNFCEENNITSLQAWIQFARSYNSQNPKLRLPVFLDRYFNKDLVWLSTHIFTREIRWLNYDEALEAIQKLPFKIFNSDQYSRYHSTKKIPAELPSRPHLHYPNFYENGGWRSFLGTNPIPFEEAIEILKTAQLHNITAYRRWRKYRHENFPFDPVKIYSDKFKSWNHYLNISTLED